MFLMSSACTIKALSASQKAEGRLGVHKELGGTQLRQLTQTDQRGVPYIMLQTTKLGGEYVQSDSIFLPKSPLDVMESCSPLDETPAFQWEAVNEFLVLLSLLNCLYFNPPAVSNLLFQFSPSSHPGEVNE